MPFALTATVSMLIVLGIMVLVHEFGHFAAAKFFKVRVEVFSIGFGKRLFGFRRGETDYRISLLPLGGYVKMAGEMAGDGTMPVAGGPPLAIAVEEAVEGHNPIPPVHHHASAAPHVADPGDFSAHPRWQRVIIGLAGPAANFVLAFVLMTVYYMMHNEVEQYLYEPAVVDVVPQNSAASHSGIQAGDRIVKFDRDINPTWEKVRSRAAVDANSMVPFTVERMVNGQPQQFSNDLYLLDGTKGQDFEIESIGLIPRYQTDPLIVHDVEPGFPADKAGLKAGDQIQAINGQTLHSVPAVMAFLQQQNGQAVAMSVLRDGKPLTLNVKPVWADNGANQMGYRLGFKANLPPFRIEQLPLPQAVRRSVSFNLQNSSLILDVLHRLFTRRSQVQQLMGPVGMARYTGEAVTMPGWQPIITLMALISINLGIFNLLPIPILDGGMILLLLIEGAIRRDLNQQFKERIYQVAFVVLVLFAVFVMFNDVSKFNIFSKLKP